MVDLILEMYPVYFDGVLYKLCDDEKTAITYAEVAVNIGYAKYCKVDVEVYYDEHLCYQRTICTVGIKGKENSNETR